MSTTVLPDECREEKGRLATSFIDLNCSPVFGEVITPVSWRVRFADGSPDQDSSHIYWSEFSDEEDVGGCRLFVSRSPLDYVSITRNRWRTDDVHEQAIYTLSPLEPARCFAFHRWGSAMTGGDRCWLYSAFGYVQGGKRVVLRISETTSSVETRPSSDPYTF